MIPRMDLNLHCAAIIPCFNEADHIGEIVALVRKHIATVIVVDDGSVDATATQAKQAGAEVLLLPKNSGKGAALRQGWQYAQQLGFEWVLMLDGDRQHDANEIPKLMECVRQTGAKLVVGNRMHRPENMPAIRRHVNRWMSRRISQLTRTEIPDSQCGFRLAHLETLLQLPLRGNRFEIESAVLVSFLAAGENLQFVPIRCIYQQEISKINRLTDTIRWLRWWLAQRAALRACNTIRVP
jgi:glycosyltransferase involved in cell wall biosynthesis